MNVKAGQKAIIIKSLAGNVGKIVDVLEYLGENPSYKGFTWNRGQGPCWLVSCDSLLHTKLGYSGKVQPHADAWLRPVSDIPDEEYEIEQIKLLENV